MWITLLYWGCQTQTFLLFFIGDSQRATEITQSLAEMLVKDLKPISTVEETGFVEFLTTLVPQYQIPSRKELEDTIMQTYNDYKAKVMAIIQKANHVTLSTEKWTLKSTEKYLTVSCHFINNWQRQEFVLETFNFTANHTDISLELKRITDEWHITDKVIVVVTEGSEILASAVQKAGWKHYPCVVHMLNWVVKKACSDCFEVYQLLEYCKSIVDLFHQNTKATKMLKQIQNQLKVPENELICSDKNVWNSMFYMLERLYEQREAVNQVLCHLKKDHLCFTKTEISLMNQTLETLRPFEKATCELLVEKYASFSKLFPIALDLLTATDSEHNALTRELRNRCQRWFSGVEQLAFMTFLDIRYKNVEYFNKDIIKMVKKNLLSQMQDLHLPGSAPAPAASTSACQSDSQVEHQPFTDSDLETEMCRFKNEEALPSDQNPLDWWKDHENIFPFLSKLAKKHLGRIMSCVPSDRLFSEAGMVMSIKRDRLDDEDVGIYLFLHQNLQ